MRILFFFPILGTATLEAFLTEVRTQEKCNWRTAYTATTANNYIRDGFRTGSSTPVSLNSFKLTCVNDPIFTLNGGSPAGGVYSGPGVNGNMFNPATAGIGTHSIFYTYNSVTVSQPITVKSCKPVLNSCRKCDAQAMTELPENIFTDIDSETEKNYFNVYPNPTSGIVNIEYVSNDNEAVSVKLFNAFGSLVYENNMEKNQPLSLDLNTLNLSTGIYYLNMLAGEKRVNQKINFVK